MLGLVADVTRAGAGYRAVLYAADTRRAVAIIEGSWRYVRLGLRSLGLAPPIGRLPKHRDCGLALVRCEPPDGLAEGVG